MKPESISDFHKRLSQWYLRYGRTSLPWRQTHDPYAIYVSEVMLQQTQVKTVLERYYFPFLERFPTLQALADAPQEDVLKHWQGLGYYNRAINMQRAAIACHGTLPKTAQELLALPGIGKNTAHALLAFAFHQPIAILEANVKRVAARIFALKTPSEKEWWDSATKLLNHKAPFDYNQAMMDVGSLICTPKTPLCDQCPASTICQGKTHPQNYPTPKAASKTPIRKRTIVVLRDQNQRIWMQPRQTRFLSGLYGFMELASTEKNAVLNGEIFALKNAQNLGNIYQIYSHFKLEANVLLLDIPAKYNSRQWHELGALKSLPMSKADEKIVKLLG